jgi:hypothetical protein
MYPQLAQDMHSTPHGTRTPGRRNSGNGKLRPRPQSYGDASGIGIEPPSSLQAWTSDWTSSPSESSDESAGASNASIEEFVASAAASGVTLDGQPSIVVDVIAARAPSAKAKPRVTR